MLLGTLLMATLITGMTVLSLLLWLTFAVRGAVRVIAAWIDIVMVRR